MRMMLVLGILVGGLLVSPTSASADDEAPPAEPASVSVSDGVLYDECFPTSYTISYPQFAEFQTFYWSAKTLVTDPNGDVVIDQDFWGASPPMSQVLPFLYCPDASQRTPGVYTVTVTLYTGDPGGSRGPGGPIADPIQNTFELRAPETETELVAARTTRRGVAVLRIHATTEARRGMVSADDATVRLQRRTSHGWAGVRGTRTTTNSRGIARVRVKVTHRRPVRLRARTIHAATATPSTSSPIVLR